jgi:predicted alpha/beta hydrolase
MMGGQSGAMTNTTEVRVRCADGFELPATVFAPASPRAVLVVAAAMGVPRRYYAKFAADMAANFA